MSLPDMCIREHEVAALECDTVAGYLEELAGFVDGPHAAILARAYRSAAMAVRARAGRHRDPGVADPPQCERKAREP